MARPRKKYVCYNCGHETMQWFGRCPGCQEWNTLVEEIQPQSSAPAVRTPGAKRTHSRPLPLSQLDVISQHRQPTGLAELDRVLGGGIVPGGVVLVGGEPGAGKSTLLLQVAGYLAAGGRQVLYVSGEESGPQIRLRADRLGICQDSLFILTEVDVEAVIGHAVQLQPALVVIDSIQTMMHPGIDSPPGSMVQVRETASRLIAAAKEETIPIFLVGHVNKGGSIAGPKVLEHAVDTVLYFEGDRRASFRILRAVKNRYGSTNEIGVFQMGSKGLEPVDNPSSFFLAERPQRVPGSVVTACMEGTRPLLVEVQALVGPSPFGGTPRRQSTGVEPRRLAMILAVLEKRCGLQLQTQDVYVNAAGGVRIEEPGADLAVAVAVGSSYYNRPVDADTIIVGEIGLAGEVRSVPYGDIRLAEAARLGFNRAIVPASVYHSAAGSGLELELVAVRSLAQGLELALPRS
ncbi:MAG TPA: DNA repair protein RadA [Firmicutes bacterium]|nr:DNA repair protein RadA [Bacillota bacterium]